MKQLNAKLFIFLLSTLFSVSSIAGGIFNVNSILDLSATNLTSGEATPGVITLRSAIEAADNLGGVSTINVPAGTYNLVLGQITFGNNVQDITIRGADTSNTIINMVGILPAIQDRIFFINPSGTQADVKTTLAKLKFTNGHLTSDIYGGGAILAGGPNNFLTIDTCAFSGNTLDATTGGTTGGAVNISGGGITSISNSAFYDNINPISDGGAVYFFLGNPATGSLTITNSLFKNNTVSVSGAGGGALGLGVQGGTTFTSSITKNTFINNTAASGSDGGAVKIDNGSTSTIQLHYNRFANNSSASGTTGLAMASAAGSVNATDNWWGCNAGPVNLSCNTASITGTGGAGTLDISTWLQLKSISSPSSVCALGDTAIITSSFLTNSANTVVSTSNLSVLIGLPIVFNNAVNGTLVNAQATIQPNGTATVGFVPNASGAGSLNTKVDNATTTPGVIINSLSLPTIETSVTQNVGDKANNYITSCELIDKAVPNGATPLTGSITSTVWIESTVPTVLSLPFVQRHYQITPATGATTATGRVTLYFLQSEFDAFNSDPASTLDLPTAPGDNAGKANLKVAKYAGVSNDGTGLPASYTNSALLIDPIDSDIVWDATNNWWAVTFDVSGFSGFIIQTSPILLPVTLTSFDGKLNSDKTATLNWNVAAQSNIKKYIVERSVNGGAYAEVGSVDANNFTAYSYAYTDATIQAGTNIYRLKIVSKENELTYSNAVSINVKIIQADVTIYPNPVQDKFYVERAVSSIINAKLIDVNGKTVKTIQLSTQKQAVDISTLTPGVYTLVLENGTTYKIIKG